MSREVVWIRAAETDLFEAWSLLNDASPGSGDRVIAALDQLLTLLSDFPWIGSVWNDPLRKILIGRSNYGLFYVVEPARLVVLGMLDLRRDPARLREEMTKRSPR